MEVAAEIEDQNWVVRINLLARKTQVSKARPGPPTRKVVHGPDITHFVDLALALP
jgi:hypothetical protein